MKSQSDILKQVVELIISEQSNEACSLFIKSLRVKLVRYLRRYRWTSEEAMDLIHDCFLMIEKKIINGEITEFNITYVKKTCQYLGANSWRKQIRKKNEYLNYVREYRHTINDEYNALYGVTLFEEEEEQIEEHQLALRAFDLLNERCQEIIRMKHVYNMNHADIVLKIASVSNENSSKTILNRCLNYWRSFYKKIKAENKQDVG